MKQIRAIGAVGVAFLFFLQPQVAVACHDGSPLVLDLNGDGIRTTDIRSTVAFDIDGDGNSEQVAWTDPSGDDGFLWLDLNSNHRVDSGRELFGDATLLPSGELASHGFEALAIYDATELGGNGDGMITPVDWIWTELRIWVDKNHDGVSDPWEVRGLSSFGILQIGLVYREIEFLDGNANVHRWEGEFLRRTTDRGAPELRWFVVEDIFFRIRHEQH